jgi:hypothetical protein
MQGDFSRDMARPGMRYTRVLAQQGRVDLDSELNEAQAILLERVRRAVVDHFGPFGGPKFLYDTDGAWGRDNEGFLVGIEPNGANIGALKLGAGRYYVDGWALDAGGARYAADQPPDRIVFPMDLPATFPFFVYLDTWERHRTGIDAPAIREVALNGLDTATRAELVWQARWLTPADLAANPPPPPALPSMQNYALNNLKDWWPTIVGWLRGTNVGRLKAWAARPDDASDNPCLADASARYTGPENQFYRVEIHEGGDATKATFKFSRNNGSDVAALADIAANALTIEPGYEGGGRFAAGNWVEVVDDRREALGLPGTLVRVLKVEGAELVIDGAAANGTLDPNDFVKPWKVRRWDQTGKGPLTLKGGAIEVKEGVPIPLEYGIRVEFEAAGRVYRTGDYWTFPARYLTGNIEWPKDAFLPPRGPQHSYAPLAVVTAVGNVVDLRRLRDPWA